MSDEETKRTEESVSVFAIADERQEATLAAIDALNKAGAGDLFTVGKDGASVGTVSGTACTTTGAPPLSDFNCGDSDS